MAIHDPYALSFVGGPTTPCGHTRARHDHHFWVLIERKLSTQSATGGNKMRMEWYCANCRRYEYEERTIPAWLGNDGQS